MNIPIQYDVMNSMKGKIVIALLTYCIYNYHLHNAINYFYTVFTIWCRILPCNMSTTVCYCVHLKGIFLPYSALVGNIATTCSFLPCFLKVWGHTKPLEAIITLPILRGQKESFFLGKKRVCVQMQLQCVYTSITMYKVYMVKLHDVIRCVWNILMV